MCVTSVGGGSDNGDSGNNMKLYISSLPLLLKLNIDLITMIEMVKIYKTHTQIHT